MNHYDSQQLLEKLHAVYSQAAQLQCGRPLKMDELLKSRILRVLSEQKQTSRRAEEKEVTVLFSDLRGFTALAEHYAPLEMIDLLNRYLTVMSRVIARFDGTIDKFMGDAILVVFGSPVAREDDLARALSCAVSMQIELDKLNMRNRHIDLPPLYMGIGINTGKVVAGELGSHIYNEYTVIGDHVNLAARMESYCLRGQILLSEHTYKRARKWIETGQHNRLSVKGKTEPVHTYELLAVRRPVPLYVPQREDRKSPRVAVHMPLSFQEVQGKAVNDEYITGDIIDLSYGGMQVATQCHLQPASEIRFPLALSVSSHQRHDVYAKVLRVNQTIHKEETFLYHLEFSSISRTAQAALKDFIDRLIAA